MIRFDDVTMVYTPGAQPALDHVSLEVEREEFVFLVGKSGSGKSTFLQLVMREMKATSGKVWVLGKDVSKLSTWAVPKLRRQIGTVFQDFRLLPSKTVYENVALAMQVIGKPRHAIETAVPDALELVGLSGKESRLPHELSGGEEQRVAIARAMVNRPELLLADEPTGNIDPELSLEMMELLERVSQTGITVLVVTHEHELVHRFHQRVVTLKNGRIISDIPADPEAIAARSAELNAWKELTEPVDDEPDEQNDETKEKEAATV